MGEMAVQSADVEAALELAYETDAYASALNVDLRSCKALAIGSPKSAKTLSMIRRWLLQVSSIVGRARKTRDAMIQRQQDRCKEPEQLNRTDETLRGRDSQLAASLAAFLGNENSADLGAAAS